MSCKNTKTTQYFSVKRKTEKKNQFLIFSKSKLSIQSFCNNKKFQKVLEKKNSAEKLQSPLSLCNPSPRASQSFSGISNVLECFFEKSDILRKAPQNLLDREDYEIPGILIAIQQLEHIEQKKICYRIEKFFCKKSLN